VSVLICIAQPAAAQDHRVIEQASIAVARGFELSNE